jgi:hypothetical protein
MYGGTAANANDTRIALVHTATVKNDVFLLMTHHKLCKVMTHHFTNLFELRHDLPLSYCHRYDPAVDAGA